MQANSLSLDRVFSPLSPGSPLRGFDALLSTRRALLTWAQAQRHLWQIRRDARRLRRALAPLDSATLRDLGLSQHQHDALHDHRHGPWQRWQW